MALSLIDSMTVEWKPESYHDTYRDRVMELIEAKRRGEKVVTEGQPAGTGKVVDLMQALERSLESAKGRRPAPSSGTERPAGTDHHAKKTQAHGGGAGGGESGDLDGLTKEELYQMAQERDLPGRSKMSRSQLLQALHKAGRAKAGGAARAS